jgi:3-keto steroid reductase
VDLVDLVSVRALSRRLVKKLPKLDAIVLNAGIGGWTGLNWPQAIWRILTDLVHEVSWPSYKVGSVGAVTGKQTSLANEPRLGMVFSANVFGHYMLTHDVVPLLQVSGQPNGPGRIIWVSSLETALDYFDPEDIQGLRSKTAYETSKTLTDILALTASLPSTAPWVKSRVGIRQSDG